MTTVATQRDYSGRLSAAEDDPPAFFDPDTALDHMFPTRGVKRGNLAPPQLRRMDKRRLGAQALVVSVAIELGLGGEAERMARSDMRERMLAQVVATGWRPSEAMLRGQAEALMAAWGERAETAERVVRGALRRTGR